MRRRIAIFLIILAMITAVVSLVMAADSEIRQMNGEDGGQAVFKVNRTGAAGGGVTIFGKTHEFDFSELGRAFAASPVLKPLLKTPGELSREIKDHFTPSFDMLKKKAQNLPNLFGD